MPVAVNYPYFGESNIVTAGNQRRKLPTSTAPMGRCAFIS